MKKLFNLYGKDIYLTAAVDFVAIMAMGICILVLAASFFL
jgi:hypothetical protein